MLIVGNNQFDIPKINYEQNTQHAQYELFVKLTEDFNKNLHIIYNFHFLMYHSNLIDNTQH